MGKFSIEFKWAVVFTAATIAWAIVEKSAGFHDAKIGMQPAFTNIFGVIALLIFGLAIHEKKKVFYNGTMTWSQGFVSGVYLSFFCTVFCPLALYIIFTYISPVFFKDMINYMVVHGERTREKAQMIFNLESYILQSVSFTLSMGVLTSAVISLFLRTKTIRL